MSDFNNDFNPDFRLPPSSSGGGDFNSDFSSDFLTEDSIRFPAKEFSIGKPSFTVSTGAQVLLPAKEFNLSLPLPIIENRTSVEVVFNTTKEFSITKPVPTIIYPIYLSFPSKEFSLGRPTFNVYNLKVISWSGGSNPEEHIVDSKKLDADAYVDLFQITLNDKSTSVYLKDNNDVTWQGNLYEGTGIKIEGVATYSDDQTSRPTLSLYNPAGVYSSLVDKGLLDNATIVRTRVLKQHIDNDQPISRSQQWRVSRVASLRSNFISLELRDMLDGQFFLTPGRMFIPPEFPQVSLT